jgi:hypothetical protein
MARWFPAFCTGLESRPKVIDILVVRALDEFQLASGLLDQEFPDGLQAKAIVFNKG